MLILLPLVPPTPYLLRWTSGKTFLPAFPLQMEPSHVPLWPHPAVVHTSWGHPHTLLQGPLVSGVVDSKQSSSTGCPRHPWAPTRNSYSVIPSLHQSSSPLSLFLFWPENKSYWKGMVLSFWLLFLTLISTCHFVHCILAKMHPSLSQTIPPFCLLPHIFLQLPPPWGTWSKNYPLFSVFSTSCFPLSYLQSW